MVGPPAGQAPLTRVEPNQIYKLALCFGADSPSTPVFVESLVLRETRDDAAPPPSVVLRALPHSPWGAPFIRSRAAA